MSSLHTIDVPRQEESDADPNVRRKRQGDSGFCSLPPIHCAEQPSAEPGGNSMSDQINYYGMDQSLKTREGGPVPIDQAIRVRAFFSVDIEAYREFLERYPG